MSVLRRKTTPKRLRLNLELDDDGEIPPCGTFVDKSPPKTTDAQIEECSIGALCLDGSAGSKADSSSSSLLTTSNSSPDLPNDTHNLMVHNIKVEKSPKTNKIDDQQRRARVSTSPIKLLVAQDRQQQRDPRLIRERELGMSSRQQNASSSTSAPKSKHSSLDISSTQINSLKPLSKSVNNQVYLDHKTHFNWNVYLELCPADVAPKEAFRQSSNLLVNKFELNMKLEAKDPRAGRVWSVATVVAKEGLRVKLRLDGGDQMNDFYELIDSENIRPCQSKPNEMLYAPVGYRGDISNYSNFIQKISTNQDTVFATQDIFMPAPPSPPKNLFKPGMKLEAIDDKNPHMICPATVSKILDDSRIKVIFDGWSEAYALVYRFDSRHLFPVNWCRDTGHQIVPPLRWDKFLEDGQPLVDMDKILKSSNWFGLDGSNRSNRNNTSSRYSRSSRANNYNKSSKINNSCNKKTKKKLVKKNTKGPIAPKEEIPSPVSKTQSPKKHHSGQKQSSPKKFQPHVDYLLEPLTPQQIQQRNHEIRMARKAAARNIQRNISPVVPPANPNNLPETSALLNTISGDDDISDSVMDQHTLMPDLEDLDCVSSISSLCEFSSDHRDVKDDVWSSKQPPTPIVLSKVNLIPAPVQASSAYRTN